MKNRTVNTRNRALLLGLLLVFAFGCERDLSDDAVEANFSTLGDVFLDAPVGLGTDFYFPYGDSNLEVINFEGTEAYSGNASLEINVPNADNPDGNYAGGIFRIDGAGRDLSGYDALTFYAKASQGIILDQIGFGEDFIDNAYQVTLTNVSVGTAWEKYVVPIPDPSKLTEVRGVFRYATGTQNTGGFGYTIWLDEIKFEKLGTVAQPRPKILEGNDVSEQTFIGALANVTGLSQTYNLGTGEDVTVVAAPAYFNFQSSNPSTATVSEEGTVSVIGSGMTTITATVAGVDAEGSLTLESLGNFTAAPVPTEDESLVISIFSDAYTNVPVDFYNGYWEPYQTTESADFTVNGDNVLNYTNFNFVGTSFSNPTVNASEMTHVHFDIFVPVLDAGAQLKITLRDFGADGVDGGTDDTNQEFTLNSSNLVDGGWASIDMPLSLANKDSMGLIIYENLGTNLTNFYADNIYFYQVPTSPTVAAPDPTLAAANVISLFSDVYTNVTVDTWRTDWSAAATILDDVDVDGNPTKKYTNLGFVGVETVSTTVDASAMTHFHMDVWSPDFTSFNIKLVDFGADNAFGGGDDTEHEISINALAQGEWVSLDIPLSDFTNLTSTANIAQYIFVGQPYEVTDVFIDNVYFHN
ncbi:glycosyl hydrolase family 16 [Mangrovimonas spongiae]|uniref:glycosyl hydrolase family 16 n=1 Tax=Mangrovimonas spongiae TaxID=2494697 RepID=UPI0019815D65|nr:glycosyl hydrolase family 16 [Mangrovimonas spongiae]